MAKASKTANKNQRAGKAVVRSRKTTQARIEEATETSMFQVFEPFKYQGVVIKPTDAEGNPVFIEMTAAEAEQYQDAGVLGTEAGEVPDTNSSDDDTANAGGVSPAGSGQAS